MTCSPSWKCRILYESLRKTSTSVLHLLTNKMFTSCTQKGFYLTIYHVKYGLQQNFMEFVGAKKCGQMTPRQPQWWTMILPISRWWYLIYVFYTNSISYFNIQQIKERFKKSRPQFYKRINDYFPVPFNEISCMNQKSPLWLKAYLGAVLAKESFEPTIGCQECRNVGVYHHIYDMMLNYTCMFHAVHNYSWSVLL